jgi:DNA-binding response OmpR family regulator
MKILVVEDEAKTSKFLKTGLSEAGYVVVRFSIRAKSPSHSPKQITPEKSPSVY